MPVRNFLMLMKKTFCNPRGVKKNFPRNIAMYGGRVWASEKLSVIAKYFNCVNQSSIRNTIRKVNELVKNSNKTKDMVDSIKHSMDGRNYRQS